MTLRTAPSHTVLRFVDVHRVGTRIGALCRHLITELDETLRIQLAL